MLHKPSLKYLLNETGFNYLLEFDEPFDHLGFGMEYVACLKRAELDNYVRLKELESLIENYESMWLKLDSLSDRKEIRKTYLSFKAEYTILIESLNL